MRFDPVVLRRMLEEVEQYPEPELPSMPVCAESEAAGAYHLRMLVEEGFLRAEAQHLGVQTRLRLTFAGQQLLDELRAVPPLAQAMGEGAVRTATGLLIALLLAKARAAGLTL